MRRLSNSLFAVRVSLLMVLVSVIAAAMPLVALASNGDPGGI